MPPLLRDRQTAVIVILAGVVPFTFGVVTGFALDRSGAVYFVLLALAALGGIGAGLEHDTVARGVRRDSSAGRCSPRGSWSPTRPSTPPTRTCCPTRTHCCS